MPCSARESRIEKRIFVTKTAIKTGYSTGNERQTPTGGTISEQIYLGFTKNKHSTDILSPRATPHKLFYEIWAPGKK